MATTKLKTVLPYGHSIEIVSPCNGATIAQYAKIVKVDEGLGSTIATISTLDRVGAEGSLYLGNKLQYKTMSFVIDVSDDRVLWDDFYSFFNKENIYRIRLDNTYYIDAAISKIDYPLWNNPEGYATINFECCSPYWIKGLYQDIGPLSIYYNQSATFTLDSVDALFWGQEFEPDITFVYGSLNENMFTGVNILPVDGKTTDIRIDFSSLFTSTSGGSILFAPCSSNQVTLNFGERTEIREMADLPNKGMKMTWGAEYLLTLDQSEVMTTTVSMRIKGLGRYYN